MNIKRFITKIQKRYKKIAHEEWLTKIKYHGLEHKHDEQLQALAKFYPAKISQIANSVFIPDPLLSPAENKRQQQEFEWYKKQKLERLESKLAAVLKEIEFRDEEIVKREPIGTIYYLDFEGATGNLTGTWTFTNGSTTVSGSGGSATSELAAGDYVRVSNGSEWYKVTSVTGDNSFEITPAFQQATVTDAADSTKYNNYDGTATTTPFVHLNQFTTDTARSLGDVLKVRANQTHLYAGIDIVFDEDGNADNMIEIRGCSSTDDPWGDGSDVEPIIGFGDTAYQFYLSGDLFWKIARLECIESSDTYGNVLVNSAHHTFFDSCVFRDSSTRGLYIKFSGGVRVIDCDFYNNISANLFTQTSQFSCEGCTFNGGAATTDYGININAEAEVALINCSFGESSSHDVADVRFYCPGASVYARNCKFVGSISFSVDARHSSLRSEDHNQTKGAHQTLYRNGTIEKDTTVVRSGGASSSAKMTPNSYCGLYYPLTIADDFCSGDFKLWLPAQQKTVTIYLRTFGYTTLPTSDELYIETSYLDEATGGHRATVKSTETVSANDTWTAFSVTFTPAQEGWVYVTVYLKKYEPNSGVYVDIKPVVS